VFADTPRADTLVAYRFTSRGSISARRRRPKYATAPRTGSNGCHVAGSMPSSRA
jgi:hypothetical protein